MKSLLAFWHWLERTVFNSINRKILGTLLFLLPFLLAPYFFISNIYSRLEAVLKAGGSANVHSSVRQIIDSGDVCVWGMGILTLLSLVIAYLLLRWQMTTPLRQVINFFKEHNNENVDLSARLPVTASGEYQELADAYDSYNKHLRDMIAELRKMAVDIAVNAATATLSINRTTSNSQEQGLLATDIFSSSDQSTSAIDQIANHSQSVSATTSNSLEMARESMKELDQATSQIEEAHQALADFKETVDELNRNSDAIQKVVSLIQNISSQTNLLALNAAVEAARAGQHGRGFAVVAEEVRTLATRVKTATDDVAESINTMNGLVRDTDQKTESIQTNIKETRAVVNDAAEHFGQIVEDFEKNTGQFMQIASATEELSATNYEIHSKITNVRDAAVQISGQMDAANDATRNLSGTTETMQEMASRFATGSGNFERILSTLEGYRNDIQAKMQAMMDRGINVLDRNYHPVAGTNPQKYETVYAEHFDRELQQLFDRNRDAVDGVIYSLLTDSQGFVATHHGNASAPPNGDYEHDVVHSRQRRFYNNEVETRRATNQKPFLLQTYTRDTGQILSDIALPIYINGQFWGSHIAGFDPEVLTRD